MQTIHQQHRLRTWLIASVALHMLLIMLVLTHRMLQESQIAKVIFEQPTQKQQTQIQASADSSGVIKPNPIVTPPQMETETIDFNLDLHKTTKFGYGSEVKKGDEAGGDESTEPPETQKQQKDPLFPPAEGTMSEGSEPQSNRHVVPTEAIGRVEKSGGLGPKTKLARLFEGFLDYMSDPRREEIIDYHAPDKRYADYMRKVGWALQNSFYLHNKPLTLEHDVHTQIMLVLEIGRDGRLMALSMSPHTTEEMLNKHINKIINKAAPFARLPDDFKRTCMKIKLPVYIDAQQGTHTYYLQF